MAEPIAPMLHPSKFDLEKMVPKRGSADPRTRARFPSQRCYAALDLGTNNCRLLIARPHGERFMVVDAFSRIVRLGEGLASSGRLSEAAMARTIAALKICADKLKRRDVYISRAVATEACRRAENGAEFVQRVQAETGILLDIISSREEARLAVLGCHSLLPPGDEPALVFDIGGGSTELVLIDTNDIAPRILHWLSVPWGVVSLSESESSQGDDADARLNTYTQMRARVRASFESFAATASGYVPKRLLGTSGTVTTLGSLYLGLEYYDRARIDGLTVPAIDLQRISQQLARQSLEERAAMNCIGTERADLVVAGCAILEEIMALWPTQEIGIADRGIREGILRGLMAEARR
jgi:exopolyphosphatase/guanosine-5'-triphosphate,3'-diphosphate pyrophosphatase